MIGWGCLVRKTKIKANIILDHKRKSTRCTHTQKFRKHSRFLLLVTVANGGACGGCGGGGGCTGGWQEATNTPLSTSMDILRKSWITTINPSPTIPPPNRSRIRAKLVYQTRESMVTCSFWPDPHQNQFPCLINRKSKDRLLLLHLRRIQIQSESFRNRIRFLSVRRAGPDPLRCWVRPRCLLRCLLCRRSLIDSFRRISGRGSLAKRRSLDRSSWRVGLVVLRVNRTSEGLNQVRFRIRGVTGLKRLTEGRNLEVDMSR